MIEIGRMESTSHVGDTDRRHNRLIVTHATDPVGLAHIAINRGQCCSPPGPFAIAKEVWTRIVGIVKYENMLSSIGKTDMTFSLKKIRYFIAAAEAGQVSHAGIHLGVSQSAITAAVQQLEDELGVDLFRAIPKASR